MTCKNNNGGIEVNELSFICNELYSTADYNNDARIVCNFRSDHHPSHNFSTIIFPPFVSQLINIDNDKRKCQVDVKMTKNECDHGLWGDDAYYLQFGVICVPKLIYPNRESHSCNAYNNDNSNEPITDKNELVEKIRQEFEDINYYNGTGFDGSNDMGIHNIVYTKSLPIISQSSILFVFFLF